MPGRRDASSTSVAKAEHGQVSGRRAPVAASGARRRGATSHPGGSPRSPTADLPMLRNSERGTLKKCEFLWWLTYEHRLKPLTDMPALRFGSLVHQALAAYYVPGVKRGVHPARAFERVYKEDLARNETIFGMRVGDDEKWVNALELGVAMLNNYIDEYGKDDTWEVLVSEHPFRCVVPYPKCSICDQTVLDGDCDPQCPGPEQAPWFRYVGVLDGVWRHRSDKTLWIPEHKTTSGIGDRNWAHLTIDDQAGSYWSWGVEALITEQLLHRNQRLNGMLYNIMRKAMPDERTSKFVNGRRVYLNLDGSVSKKQPSPYFKRQPIFRDEFDRSEAKRRSAVDFKRIQMFRSGELELSKSPGQFTCPSCAMRDACELHETGNDWQGFIAQATQTWDPYEAHEIYDGR